METTTKLALGVSALCCLVTTAFAGGPEMPMIDMNGINLGVGGAYNSYKYDMTQSDFTAANLEAATENQAPTVNKFGPVGQLGYTYAGDNWIFGVVGQFEYDDVRNFTNDFGIQLGNAQVMLRSHINAMLLGGLKVNDANAVYLEGGYTAFWGKSLLGLDVPPGAGAGPLSTKYTLNGGIAGVGWRHYFINNVFVDLSYSFALYGNKESGVILPATNTTAPALLTATQTMSGIKRLTVNGVTATANYLFNV